MLFFTTRSVVNVKGCWVDWFMILALSPCFYMLMKSYSHMLFLAQSGNHPWLKTIDIFWHLYQSGSHSSNHFYRLYWQLKHSVGCVVVCLCSACSRSHARTEWEKQRINSLRVYPVVWHCNMIHTISYAYYIHWMDTVLSNWYQNNVQ